MLERGFVLFPPPRRNSAACSGGTWLVVERDRGAAGPCGASLSAGAVLGRTGWGRGDGRGRRGRCPQRSVGGLSEVTLPQTDGAARERAEVTRSAAVAPRDCQRARAGSGPTRWMRFTVSDGQPPVCEGAGGGNRGPARQRATGSLLRPIRSIVASSVVGMALRRNVIRCGMPGVERGDVPAGALPSHTADRQPNSPTNRTLAPPTLTRLKDILIAL